VLVIHGDDGGDRAGSLVMMLDVDRDGEGESICNGDL